jgi:hypothetical protein
MTKISEEAAREALKRGRYKTHDVSVAELTTTSRGNHFPHVMYALAEAIQELWDACPEKGPKDNKLLAMEFALNRYRTSTAVCETGDMAAKLLLESYTAKLAELGQSKSYTAKLAELGQST